MELLQRIEQKRIIVSVVGLGYVGLPLAVEFAKAGFKVISIELSPERYRSIKRKISYIEDVPTKVLASLVDKGMLSVSNNLAGLPPLPFW